MKKLDCPQIIGIQCKHYLREFEQNLRIIFLKKKNFVTYVFECVEVVWIIDFFLHVVPIVKSFVRFPQPPGKNNFKV